MSGLGPEAMELIAAAREGDEPTQADQDRVEAAIAARLATTAAIGLAAGAAVKSSISAPATSRAIGSLGLAGVRPWLAAAVLVSVAALGVVAVRVAMLGGLTSRAIATAGTTAVPPASLSAEEPARVVEPPTNVPGNALGPAAPEEPGGPVERRARVVAAPASVAPGAVSTRAGSPTSDVAAEVLLLGDAHAAIRNGQAEHALVLLDEHARRFPRGALGEERDASRITALCALGRVAEARAAADRFLRVSPLSPHAGRVRDSCGGSP